MLCSEHSRTQGFEFPKAKQILVNLQGGDFKKRSSGLELAMAIAILLATKQVSPLLVGKERLESVYIYGELGLNGSVLTIDEDSLLGVSLPADAILITGESKGNLGFDWHIKINSLRDFVLLTTLENQSRHFLKKEKEKNDDNFLNQSNSYLKEIFSLRGVRVELDSSSFFESLSFSKSEAELLKLISFGRHSLLLMGPRGLGKTTLAEALNYLAPFPEWSDYLHYKKYFPLKEKKFWSPFVKPHHSVSHLGLIGGGAKCAPGEITRAHRGILFLDEFLELSTKCQESLREPIIQKEVNLVRGNEFHTYPCDFQLIATTNLCPCGQWLPENSRDCDKSFSKCIKYRERLSGPIVDRFDVFYFLRKAPKAEKTISLIQIRREVEALRDKFFSQQVDLNKILFQIEDLSLLNQMRFKDEISSLRRQNASIRVAKTIAAINGRDRVLESDFDLALSFCWSPIIELKI